jgi:hypothetical protein
MEHTLDLPTFRTLFPVFADTTKYPDALIQTWYTVAGEYLGLCDYREGLNGNTLDLALMQLTAHLMWSSVLLSSGKGAPMVMTSATIDKVSISTMAPPAADGWSYWLNTTPYGTMLWALLSMKSAGGWVYGGRPELRGFRKIAGRF